MSGGERSSGESVVRRAAAGNPLAQGARQTDAWLKKLLEKRRDTLAADSTWIEAVDRVAAYEKQRRKGNWDLTAALKNDVRAMDCWGASYPGSGYTVRSINPDGTWSTPSSYTYSCN